MLTEFQTVVLWLFVIFLGIATGAGIYEERVVVPFWFGTRNGGVKLSPENMRNTDPGRNFWVFVSTIPLTILAIMSLTVSTGPGCELWLSAAVIELACRFATFCYFIPRALRMMRADADAESPHMAAMAKQWQMATKLRSLLTLVAWIFALKSLVDLT